MSPLAITVLAVIVIAGLAAIPFGLPGVVIIAAGYLAAGLIDEAVDWKFFIILASAGVFSEIFEWLVSMYGARKFGTSKRGVIGAVIGAIIGALVGVPVFLVGSLLGLLAGAYLGALLVEYHYSGDMESAMRSAKGALLGRVTAIAVKLIIGVICAGAIAYRVANNPGA